VSSDPYGLAFRVRDPPLLLGEVAHAYNQAGAARRQDQQDPNQEGNGAQTQQQVSDAPTRRGGLPGTVKLGAMVLTGQFTEQLVGSLAASPASSAAPALQHSGDFIAYGVIDQMLWRVPGGPGERALNGFMRVAAAPDNRNAVSLYVDGGLTFRGLVDSRPNDQIGLAVAYGRVSPQVAAFYGDVVSTTGTPMPIPDYETTIELTYRAQLAPNLSLQPDLQYIIHPGGNVAHPRDPSGATAIPNAFRRRPADHLEVRTITKTPPLLRGDRWSGFTLHTKVTSIT
jgi:porin